MSERRRPARRFTVIVEINADKDPGLIPVSVNNVCDQRRFLGDLIEKIAAYTIQTVSGYYLAFGNIENQSKLSTDVSDPNAAPRIHYSAKFRLYMFDL